MDTENTIENGEREQRSLDGNGSDVWARAVDTLASMCVSEKMGRGPTKEAFVFTLRLYADEMEKLISSKALEGHILPEDPEWPECSGDPASCPENSGWGCCLKYRNRAPN